MKLVFFETPLFSRLLPDYLDDEGYRALQGTLPASPDLGDVMPGTGGFRKLRWEDARRGKGRRGGLRIIYYLLCSPPTAKSGFSRSATKTRQPISVRMRSMP